MVFIFLFLSAFLLGMNGSSLAADNSALIIVDEQSSPDVILSSETTLANLLGHFDIPYEIKTVDTYQKGDVDNYRMTFYIGNSWDRTLPTVFLDDVMVTNSRVVWINWNLWKLGWDRKEAFEARFGIRFNVVAPTNDFTKVTYKNKTLFRSQDNYSRVAILDGAKAKAMAYITGGGRKYPYIVQSANFYFVADNPLIQTAENSPYLAFADALHEMVGIDHATSHRALVRIEDIDYLEDPARIRAIANYLSSQNVPFALGVTPRFADPFGAWGPPQTLDISDNPELVSALNYAVSKGGTIVMHGFTHQYDGFANPYNGVTGLDSEFYIQQIDSFGNIYNISPVPEDSTEWVQGRIDSGLDIFAKAGLPRPLIWETPHYLASDLDHQVFSSNFSISYDRFANTYFPFVINRSIYGSKVIPENLGYLSPGLTTPSMLISRADKNLVIRDGFASFFYHSEVDISYLKTTVRGLKNKGYTFVDVKSL